MSSIQLGWARRMKIIVSQELYKTKRFGVILTSELYLVFNS